MNEPEVFQLDPDQVARQMLAGRIHALTHSLMASVLSSPLGTLLLAWVQAGVAGWGPAIGWLCLVNLVELLIFALARRARRAQEQGGDALRWTRYLFLGQCLLGLAWGSSVWFFWTDGQYLHYLMNLCVLVGVSGICVVVMSPFRLGMALFTAGILLMPLLHLVWTPNPFSLQISLGLIVLFVLDLQYGATAQQQLLAGLENAARNEQLLHELDRRTGALETSQSELNRAQAVGSIGSWVFDIVHDSMKLSAETCRTFGLPLGVTGSHASYMARTLGQDRDALEQAWQRALRGEAFDHEHRIVVGGAVRWVRQKAEFEYSSDGTALSAVGITQDITVRKQMEEALLDSERRYRTLIEWSPEPIGVHRKGRILYVNPAAVKVFGASSAQQLIGTPMLDRVHPEFHQIALTRAQQVTEQGRANAMIEQKFLKLDGSVIDMEVQSIAIAYDGEPAIQVSMRDITERKAAAHAIEHLAFYDSLTDLPNRRLMLDRLGRALTGSTRHGRWGALMLIDLDNFKMLNDTLGHAVGDQLLVEVAARLRASVREGDTVARLGGDEFVVILEDLTEGEQSAVEARGVATKILVKLGESYLLDVSASGTGAGQRNHHCTSSIGITMLRDQNASVDELMKRADTAMYQAKAAGRNALRFFDPEMQTVVSLRAEMEVDLRCAIQAQQFELHYQPQVDAAGRVVGAEALLRWQHPQRGWVMPGEFIPLAEDTGLILPLGQWVLETACAQLALWAATPDLAHLTLAVNVSARQFAQVDMVQQVLAAVDAAGAPPRRLMLELTESLLLENAEDIIRKMMALKARGVGFSLDDFGTGYSSLSYLKRLPLDELKIDQSFVRDLLTDPNDAAIARTILALGHTLNLGAIAEGVETQGQHDFLGELGCHRYQGYFFSRPVPVALFEGYCRRIFAALECAAA
jgi:diguanylate cyclase (GGDEF)-like protein/PAS domain S-box-containing protein